MALGLQKLRVIDTNDDDCRIVQKIIIGLML